MKKTRSLPSILSFLYIIKAMIDSIYLAFEMKFITKNDV